MKWIKRSEANTVKEVFMQNQNLADIQDANKWFIKSKENNYKIDKLSEAADMIMTFKDKPVWISGDYDVDGITATSIMVKVLKKLGFSNVNYMIPSRSEGFGINTKMIDRVKKGSLIITVDNGVAQVEAVQKAMKKGIKVIVTDHHLPENEEGQTVQNPADIVIDPNAVPGQADFNGYCGAGLAYKLALHLMNYDKEACYEYLALAAIGTVADVMELTSENYVFVRNGLKVLTCPQYLSTGLWAILSTLGYTAYIDEQCIGYTIGPVLNAASRMVDDGAISVVALLCGDKSFESALADAEKIKELNDLRKQLTKEAVKKAMTVIAQNGYDTNVPLVVNIPDVKASLIGIVAGNLAEKFQVPTVAVTNENGILRGSARTAGGFNIKEALDTCSDLFIHYGGHAGAAGVALEEDNFESLRVALQKTGLDYIKPVLDTIEYDLEISSNDILKTIDTIQGYAPFGQGNTAPVFLIKDYKTVVKSGQSVSFIGPEKDSVRLSGSVANAVGFGLKDVFKDANVNSSFLCDIVGTLSYNYFNGKKYPQVTILDARLH